jgi:hypothetical protein
MVSTRDGSAEAEATPQNGHSLPQPTLAQVIASICESRDEQTILLHHLVTNSNCEGLAVSNA